MAEVNLGIPFLQNAWDVNQKLYDEPEQEKHWLQSFGDSLRAFSSGMVGQDTLDDSFGAGAAKLDQYITNTRNQRKMLKAQRERDMNNSFLALARLLKPAEPKAGSSRGTGTRNFKREQLAFVNDVRHRLINGKPVAPNEFDLARNYIADLNEPQYREVIIDQYGNTEQKPIPGSGMGWGDDFFPKSMDAADLGHWLKLPQINSLIDPNFVPGQFDGRGVMIDRSGGDGTSVPGTGFETTPETEATLPESELEQTIPGFTNIFPQSKPAIPDIPPEVLDGPDTGITPGFMGELPFPTQKPDLSGIPDGPDTGVLPGDMNFEQMVEQNLIPIERQPHLPFAGTFGATRNPQFLWDDPEEQGYTLLPRPKPDAPQILPEGPDTGIASEFVDQPNRDGASTGVIPGFIDEPPMYTPQPFWKRERTPALDTEVRPANPGAEIEAIINENQGPRIRDMPAIDSEVRPPNPDAEIERIINENQTAPVETTPPLSEQDKKDLETAKERVEREDGTWAGQGGADKLSAPITAPDNRPSYTIQDSLNSDISGVNANTSLDSLTDAQVAKLAITNPDLLMDISRKQREAARSQPPPERGSLEKTGSIGSTRRLSGQEVKDLGNMRSAIRNMNKAMNLMLDENGMMREDAPFHSLKLGVLGQPLDPKVEEYLGYVAGIYPLILNLRTGAAFNDNELGAVNSLLRPNLLGYKENYNKKMFTAMDELVSRSMSLYNKTLSEVVEWSKDKEGKKNLIPDSLRYELDRVPDYYWNYLDTGGTTRETEPAPTEGESAVDSIFRRFGQ